MNEYINKLKGKHGSTCLQTLGTKAGITEAQGQMFEVNLGHLRPCFRKPKGKKNKLDYLFLLPINVSRTT